MRLQALRARPRRRRLPPDLGERQVAAVAPNVLDRTFEAPAPNDPNPAALQPASGKSAATIVSLTHLYTDHPLPTLSRRTATHASRSDRNRNAPGSVRIHAWPVFLICLSALLTLVSVLSLSWFARVALRTVFF
jgi:hypothetical protein